MTDTAPSDKRYIEFVWHDGTLQFVKDVPPRAEAAPVLEPRRWGENPWIIACDYDLDRAEYLRRKTCGCAHAPTLTWSELVHGLKHGKPGPPLRRGTPSRHRRALSDPGIATIG